jgi:membrane protease YdiL (CAAX protease family)
MRVRDLLVTSEGRPALFWRAIGYLFAFGLCMSIRGPLMEGLEKALADLQSPLPLLIASTVVMAVVVTSTVSVTFVFRRFVDRRAWKGMACPAPWQRPRDLVGGLVIGGVMLLGVALVEYALGWFRVAGWKEGMSAAVVAGLLASRLIYFIGTAVCEELAYRGYLLENVGARYPIWVAVLITGAVFGLSHLMAIGFSWRFVLAAVLVSFFLAIMRLATRAIWMGVGWHLGWDWTADGLGLVPGYSPLQTERLGPALWAGQGLAIEGGLLIILLLAVALALALATFRRAGWKWSARLTPQGELVSGWRPGDDSSG